VGEPLNCRQVLFHDHPSGATILCVEKREVTVGRPQKDVTDRSDQNGTVIWRDEPTPRVAHLSSIRDPPAALDAEMTA
jgi:hypothetical protein